MDGLRTADGAGLNLSDDELEAGVVVDNRRGVTEPAPRVDRGASERATTGSGVGSVIALAAMIALLALLALGLVRMPAPSPRRT